MVTRPRSKRLKSLAKVADERESQQEAQFTPRKFNAAALAGSWAREEWATVSKGHNVYIKPWQHLNFLIEGNESGGIMGHRIR